VLPSDEVETDMWRDGPSHVIFQMRVGSRVVLSGGVAELKGPSARL